MVFNRGRFKKMLSDRHIPWVYKKKKVRGGGYTDDLDYEVETFEAMSALYPDLSGLVRLVKLFERIKLRSLRMGAGCTFEMPPEPVWNADRSKHALSQGVHFWPNQMGQAHDPATPRLLMLASLASRCRSTTTDRR